MSKTVNSKPWWFTLSFESRYYREKALQLEWQRELKHFDRVRNSLEARILHRLRAQSFLEDQRLLWLRSTAGQKYLRQTRLLLRSATFARGLEAFDQYFDCAYFKT